MSGTALGMGLALIGAGILGLFLSALGVPDEASVVVDVGEQVNDELLGGSENPQLQQMHQNNADTYSSLRLLLAIAPWISIAAGGFFVWSFFRAGSGVL